MGCRAPGEGRRCRVDRHERAAPDRRRTREELTRWWSEGPAAWGIVTGRISGVVVLNFDGEAGLETLRKLNLRPHVRTGSGGAHLYLRHPGWKVPTLNGKSPGPGRDRERPL